MRDLEDQANSPHYRHTERDMEMTDKVPGPQMSNEEYLARFSELPCCGHVAAVHSDKLQRCVSSAGMDPDESCDCPKYRT